MNPRIRELVEQAGFTVEDGHIQSLANKQIKKLIELLEKEFGAKHFSEGYRAGMSEGTIETARACANIARNANLRDVEGGDAAVLNAAADQIKEHFGVDKE